MSALEAHIYRLIKAVFILLGRVPRRWSFSAGRCLGRILFALDGKHRQIALENLTRAFRYEKQSWEIRRLAKKVFENLGRILFEIGWSMQLSKEDFHRYFHITGISNIQNAFRKNQGCLVLTAHMGNWELLTVVAAMTGCPTSIVVRPLDFAPLQAFFREYRTRLGADLIPSKQAARIVLKSLKQKRLVAMLMDQNVDWYEGVFVRFFERYACTNRGLAALALKTGAPVVPVFIARQGLGYNVEFGQEIPLVKTGDKTKDVESNTQQYNDTIEAFVRRYPDQWFWVHQRWKTRPCRPWPMASSR